jgi:hypothetical protein
MAKKKSVFCIAASDTQTIQIVDRLKAAGFSGNDISVLLPDKSGTKDFAHEHHTKAPEGAAVGAGSGAVVGGALGWLAGIGSLAIPGVGPFIAAGPLMATLGGAAVGGAVGGVTGALIGLGMPEYEAKQYEGKIRNGGALISVHSDNSDEVNRAKKIFKDSNADAIAVSGETAVKSGT